MCDDLLGPSRHAIASVGDTGTSNPIQVSYLEDSRPFNRGRDRHEDEDTDKRAIGSAGSADMFIRSRRRHDRNSKSCLPTGTSPQTDLFSLQWVNNYNFVVGVRYESLPG